MLRLFRQLCHALGAAHAAGVVHRDLKPENVFLAKARTLEAPTLVKVLDFGIAKLLSSSPTANTALVGTPAWMAPEQTDPRASITPATDVWALGLLAFWMLTARTFWLSANDAESSLQVIMRECLVEPIPSASQRAAELGVWALLPPRFDAWFARCVDREPRARFASVVELLRELELTLGATGPTLLAADAATAVAPVGGGSGEDIGVLSTQRYPEREPRSGAAPPLPPQPAPLVATTMSPHGLATGAPVARRGRGRGLLWGGIALVLMAVGGAAGGSWYWLGAGGAARARTTRRARGAATGTSVAARPAAVPGQGPAAAPPFVPNVGESKDKVPASFDAFAYLPEAQRAAEAVAPGAVLVTFMAAGVTDAGVVDLRQPDHQVAYSYRAAGDGRCAFVMVTPAGRMVSTLTAGTCAAGPLLGPPRCNLAQVLRKAQTGMTVSGQQRLVLKYGPNLQGKATWAANWGSELSVGNLPDDCAPAGR